MLAAPRRWGSPCRPSCCSGRCTRCGFRYRPRFGWRGVGLRSAGRVAGWTFFAALVGQLGFIVTSRVVTSAVAQGGPGKGAYDNAFLLFMLPHSLITVSLVTALFTRMSHAAAAGDEHARYAATSRSACG